VQEVDFPRVAELRLGDLTARCEQQCSEASLRSALYAGAAHVGASTIVGVQCVQRGEARACSAAATAPRVDPALAEAH
jgi:hypothetical protein